MFIVGLTGGIATGKSTVLDVFSVYGVAVVDADTIAREIMQKGTDAWRKIGQCFGESIYCEDGTINRPMLAEIVFNDAAKRRQLNAITHPKIQTAMITKAIVYFLRGHSYVVMEIPLLFETGRMVSFMYKIITVICHDDQQVTRLSIRNNFDLEVAELRINSQMPLSEKAARSNFVIDNSGDIVNTRNQTEAIIIALDEYIIPWYVGNAAKILIVGTLSVYLYNFLCNM